MDEVYNWTFVVDIFIEDCTNDPYEGRVADDVNADLSSYEDEENPERYATEVERNVVRFIDESVYHQGDGYPYMGSSGDKVP